MGTYSYAGFTWQGYNYDEVYGVENSNEIALKNSNRMPLLTKPPGLVDAVSIAAFTWTGDRAITFICYRGGSEVAHTTCFCR